MYAGLFCASAVVVFVGTLAMLNAAGLPLDIVSVYLALSAAVSLGGLITWAVMATYFSNDR